MRMLCVGAILVAMSASVMAADARAQVPETVLIEGGTLSGVWKISAPESFGVDLLQHSTFGAMKDEFCRIEQVRADVAVHCLGSHFYSRDGTLHVEGTKLHLAWGMPLLRMVIDGTLQSSSSFVGTFAFKLSGIVHHNPALSTGTKLTLSETAPDKAGKAALLERLLGELANGPLLAPHDDAAMKRNAEDIELPTPNDLQALGAVKAVIHLGGMPGGDRNVDDFFSVYDVEFVNGERLCGLHQRDDGALDGLVCV